MNERRSELRADPEKVREFIKQSREKRAYTPKGESKWVTCAREGCERQFYQRASELRKNRKYCSRECWTLAQTDEQKRARAQAAAVVTRQRKGEANPAFKHGKRAGVRDRAGERRFKSGQDRCVHPACEYPAARAHHEHHVVYRQHVRREGGDIYDPRNALRLCVSCHSSHHRRGSKIVPLAALRDENYEFAFELLGAAAFDYLRRRYSGDDVRLHRWLARVTAAVDGGDSQ